MPTCFNYWQDNIRAFTREQTSPPSQASLITPHPKKATPSHTPHGYAYTDVDITQLAWALWHPYAFSYNFLSQNPLLHWIQKWQRHQMWTCLSSTSQWKVSVIWLFAKMHISCCILQWIYMVCLVFSHPMVKYREVGGGFCLATWACRQN